MTAQLKPQTGELVESETPQTMKMCFVCGTKRRTYHDAKGNEYYMRHQQSGRSNWCRMSSQKVTTK